jgi:hypothetical protein
VFGKTVGDVACLLDVLSPDRAFQQSITDVGTKLSVGVICEQFDATKEVDGLFRLAEDCLGSIIGPRDLRLPMLKRAREEGCAQIIMAQGLKSAWATYFEGVDGPMQSLEDVVNWHAQHPVSDLDRSLRVAWVTAHDQSESFHPDHPGQSLLVAALQPQSPSSLLEAEATARQLESEFYTLMDVHGLDVVMMPWADGSPILATLANLPIVSH